MATLARALSSQRGRVKRGLALFRYQSVTEALPAALPWAGIWRNLPLQMFGARVGAIHEKARPVEVPVH